MKGTFYTSLSLYTAHLMFLPTIKAKYCQLWQKKRQRQQQQQIYERWIYETYEDGRIFFLSVSYIILKNVELKGRE